MATKENINWKRINMGDILPCQSFLRKKDGEILKLSTSGGVKVGQDCYYLPVDEVINVIKDYPIEEFEDERIRKAILELVRQSSEILEKKNQEQMIAWLEKQGEHANFRNKIQIGDKVTRNEDGVLVNLSQLNSVAKKQGEQKSIKVPKFKVGDIIRLKGTVAEYTIKKVTDTTYYTDGWSCGIERCEEDYELVEQKPWSEEDENHVKSILSTIECCKAQFPNAQSVVEAYNAYQLAQISQRKIHLDSK